ncbi:MAG: DUF2330 domain-containing protein [Myxococcales bacterium]|nr:DUF2330 domain-containing protein [Myxococcales bacterium]
MKPIGTVLAATAGIAATAAIAHAFCGFYVAGSNAKLFNDATQVVLMREGTRTVLSMQNDYKGPLEDFAMVVPVPVVLKPTDVKVLDPAVFDRINGFSAPRLVEYWEEDPCPPPEPEYTKYRRPNVRMKMMSKSAPMAMDMASEGGGGGGGYYEAEEKPRRPVPPILSSFSAYPQTVTANVATPVTWSFGFSNQPYPEPTCTVDHGVGTVYNGQPASVTLAASSTLKITCANSAGKSEKTVKINAVKIEAKFDVAEYQILILSASEAAGLEDWLKINNYKIPAGAEPLLRPYIESGMKFFVAKVDPKKVKMVDGRGVLSPLRFHYDSEEFSLPIRLGLANSSGKQDLIINILSASKRYETSNYKNVFIPTNFDVRPSVKTRFAEFYAALFDKTIEANPGSVVTEYAWTAVPSFKCDPCTDSDLNSPDLATLGADVTGGPMATGNFVLTRLHARYGKTDMKDDLRFKEGAPMTGGREQWSKQGLEYGAAPSSQNYFQARYAIRHWWTGSIKCKNPRRGVWGGPPDGAYQQTLAAGRTAFAPRGKLELATVIGRDLWEIGYKKKAPPPKTPPAGTKTMSLVGFGAGGVAALVLIGLTVIVARRRRA